MSQSDSSSQSSVRVVTLGCRLNTFESEKMLHMAQKAGLQDTILVNTCAVTQEAERQARQTIRKLKRDHPHARIIVTGCSAQVHPELYTALPQVEQVWGNQDKVVMESYTALQDPNEPNARVKISPMDHLVAPHPHPVTGFEGRSRAFIEIQNGCNHDCTFCIIQVARGPHRSIPMGHIVSSVRQYIDKGFQEVVLTGVDMTGYGQDLPGRPSLGQMVRRLLKAVPELPRLRISSLDPVEIDDELVAVWRDDPRLMPHVHLSIQSGDDMILKRMKRRHLRHHVFEIVERLRAARPNIVLGADVIAGFPTETHDMFEATRTLVQKCGITYLHVFPFSPRPGTPAARMPQVPKDIVRERARILREDGKVMEKNFLMQNGHGVHQVLLEKDDQGRTEHHVWVTLDAPLKGGTGTIQSVNITHCTDQHWVGCVVSPDQQRAS